MRVPLITVVVPCFNCERTVEETLRSVQAQTLRDFEILVVNDGSLDGTGRLLEAYAAGEPRVRVLHRANGGLAAARNTGIKAARGRYVALIDADDLWDPTYLAEHVANLADPHIGVSYARVRSIEWGGAPNGDVTRPKLTGLTPADLLRTNPCTSLIVIRREIFRDVGLFNEALRRVEDQEFLFRVTASGWRLEGLDRVLSSYRISPGSLSSNTEAMLASYLHLLEVAAKIAPGIVAQNRRLALAAMYRYLARRSLDHDHGAEQARTWLLAALKMAPDLIIREPRSTIATLLAVLLPGGNRAIFGWRLWLQGGKA